MDKPSAIASAVVKGYNQVRINDLEPATMALSLEELEEQIEAELLILTPKQRRFALIYGDGEQTVEQAAISAGYSAKHANRNAYRVRQSAATAIKLIQRRNDIQQGESIGTHRERLLTLFELCATPGSPTWEPRTAHSIRRTLLELDGYIKESGKSSTSVTINVIDPVAGITIEQDMSNPELPAIEHEPTKNQ